jgi:hypothetical protein
LHLLARAGGRGEEREAAEAAAETREGGRGEERRRGGAAAGGGVSGKREGEAAVRIFRWGE